MRNHIRRFHKGDREIGATHSGKRLDKLQKRVRKELFEDNDDLQDDPERVDNDNYRRSGMKMRRIRISNDKQDKADEEDTSELVMTEESWENQEDTSELFGVTEESWENLKAAESKMIVDKQNKCDACGKKFITSTGME